MCEAFARYGNRRFDANNTTTLAPGLQTAVCNPQIDPATNKLIGYSFDNAGNTKLDAENREFIYDGENKQVEVKDQNGATVGKYYYNGDGQRIKKLTATESTFFVYNAGRQLVEEYSPQIAQPQDAKVSYLTSDHLGSPRITTDANGQVISRRDFQPFGEEIARAGYGTDDVRQKFTTYERDGETGLDFAVNRMYASLIGRFTQVDPYNIVFEKEKGRDESERQAILVKYIADPQIWNRFSYVVNSPLKFSDPDGRRPQTREEKSNFDYLRKLAADSNNQEFKTALLNAIKGIEDAITASRSTATDPFGLKVALWAISRAAMPNSSSWGKNGNAITLINNGRIAMVPAVSWKCNMFVAQALVYGGGMVLGGNSDNSLPVSPSQTGNTVSAIAGILGGVVGAAITPTPVNLLTANQWGDTNSNAIANFDTTGSSAMGNVIGWTWGGVNGHVAISIGADVVIYAGPDNVKVNTIMDVNRTFKKEYGPSYRDPQYRMKKP